MFLAHLYVLSVGILCVINVSNLYQWLPVMGMAKQHYTGNNDCKYLVWQIALNLDQWIPVSGMENTITHMHTQKMSAKNLKSKGNILLQTGWLVHACSHFWKSCISWFKKLWITFLRGVVKHTNLKKRWKFFTQCINGVSICTETLTMNSTLLELSPVNWKIKIC